MNIQSDGSGGVKFRWTFDEDARLVCAIGTDKAAGLNEYIISQSKPKGVFALNWFKDLLPNIDKNAEQIRDRWVNNLSRFIKAPVVLEEDREVITDLQRQFPGDWNKISRKSLVVLGGRGYSYDAIERFFNKTDKRKFPSDDLEGEYPLMKKARVSRNSPVLKESKDEGCGTFAGQGVWVPLTHEEGVLIINRSF